MYMYLSQVDRCRSQKLPQESKICAHPLNFPSGSSQVSSAALIENSASNTEKHLTVLQGMRRLITGNYVLSGLTPSQRSTPHVSCLPSRKRYIRTETVLSIIANLYRSRIILETISKTVINGLGLHLTRTHPTKQDPSLLTRALSGREAAPRISIVYQGAARTVETSQ